MAEPRDQETTPRDGPSGAGLFQTIWAGHLGRPMFLRVALTLFAMKVVAYALSMLLDGSADTDGYLMLASTSDISTVFLALVSIPRVRDFGLPGFLGLIGCLASFYGVSLGGLALLVNSGAEVTQSSIDMMMIAAHVTLLLFLLLIAVPKSRSSSDTDAPGGV